jgi:anti-sigma-K factor RskA
MTLHDDDMMLAAEYALGVMQGAEREAFARRIAAEPSLAAMVREWDEDFVAMSDDIAPVVPPRHVQKKIEDRLFATSPAQESSLWNSLNFWRGLAIASVAGVVALGSWGLMRPGVPLPQNVLVAQVAGDASAVRLVAHYDQANGLLRLNRTEGAAVAGRSLELWLIAGTDAPVSLGVLPDGNTSSVSVPASLRGKFKDGVLAISDEPLGGSTTGAPTGAVVATGKLIDI